MNLIGILIGRRGTAEDSPGVAALDAKRGAGVAGIDPWRRRGGNRPPLPACHGSALVAGRYLGTSMPTPSPASASSCCRRSQTRGASLRPSLRRCHRALRAPPPPPLHATAPPPPLARRVVPAANETELGLSVSCRSNKKSE